MTEGANPRFQIFEEVVGTAVHPVNICNIMDTDHSSLYHYTGTDPDEKKSQLYARVEVQDLEYCERNGTSILKVVESHEEACRKIRVKYVCSNNAAGCVFPKVMIFSGSLEKIQPNIFKSFKSWVCAWAMYQIFFEWCENITAKTIA